MKRCKLKISEIDMRDAFFDELYNIARMDKQVVFLTADMSAYSLGRFKNDLKGQYINVGIAEQNMVSIAAGLALGGKTVFVYGIVPFVTLRCYEQIKVDLCCMNLPVTIIGVGAGYTYGSDGPTHHATQDIAVMRALPEMTILNPSDSVATAAFARMSYKSPGPTYIRIERGKLPLIYEDRGDDFSDGLSQIRTGSDLTIIATGVMVHNALMAADKLKQHSVSAGVVDLYRLKPLNCEMLLKIIDKTRRIVTLEENTIIGGIGSAVSEILADNSRSVPLKRIAIPDQHCFESAERESLHAIFNLDRDGIVKTILREV